MVINIDFESGRWDANNKSVYSIDDKIIDYYEIESTLETKDIFESHQQDLITIYEYLSSIKEKGIEIEGEDKVAEYLSIYPELLPILVDICNEALKEFKDEAKIFVLVYQDPEIDDKHLKILVRMSKYEDDIMDRIEKVRSKFRDKIAESEGYIHFSTDFKYI